MASGSSFAYTYDLAGNRTGVTVDGSSVANYSYDATDQVVGWTYDGAGNLSGDGTAGYSYNVLNRLSGTAATGQSHSNRYRDPTIDPDLLYAPPGLGADGQPYA